MSQTDAPASSPSIEREPWRESATALAASIRAGERSSVEVVEAHLARIDEVNPKVNAVTSVLEERALAAAEAADEAVSRGDELGPLHGVPFTIKDNIDLIGSPTTHGIAAFAGAIPDTDAPVVARMLEAGAIPLARTNMPDFGMRWHTDNALHGATVNPWDPGRSPGGSSGGEAVALATGMSPLGLGNDYGGSLRLPSLAAGTTALRPTFARVAAASAIEPKDLPMTLQLMAVEGPMARRVADVELAYGVLRQPDRRDPWWAPIAEPVASARPVRVAVCVDPGGLGTSVEVKDAIRRAADALADAGFEVEERDPPDVMKAAELWRSLTAADLRPIFSELEPLMSADSLEHQRQHLSRVPELDLAGYIQAFTERQAIARAWSLFFAEHPLVLGPVATERVHPVGFDLGGPDNAEALWLRHRLMVTANFLGLPALAVPAGLAADGFPTGVQLIGDRYREDLCLGAGRVIEARRGLDTPIDPR